MFVASWVTWELEYTSLHFVSGHFGGVSENAFIIYVFPECPFHGGPVQAIGCRATNPQCLWERHSQGCRRGRALSMQFANDHPGTSQHFPLKRIEQVLFLWQIISEQFRIQKTNELLHIGGSKGPAQVQKLNAYVAPMMLCVNRPQESQEMPRPRHHDITTCTVVRCLVQKERALLQELSNRWKLYGVCMRFHTQDDLTQESKTMRTPPKIFQRFKTGFKIWQDLWYILFYILKCTQHEPNRYQTVLHQSVVPVKPGFCPRWRRRPGNPRWDWQTRAPGHWTEHVRQVRLTLSACASRKIMCSKCNMFAEHENWQSENDRIASWKYSCREFMKTTLSFPWVDSLIWITVALVHLRLPLWRVPDRRSWARMPRPRPRWSRQTRGTRWIKRIRAAKSHEPIWVAALIGRKVWLHFNTIIKKESRFGAPKTEKAHPKRFDIYWPFMLYFRFRMSAKSVNILYVNISMVSYCTVIPELQV